MTPVTKRHWRHSVMIAVAVVVLWLFFVLSTVPFYYITAPKLIGEGAAIFLAVFGMSALLIGLWRLIAGLKKQTGRD